MKIKDILGINNAYLAFGDLNVEIDFNHISKDTRTIKENDTFIGIKGENFDGNNYWEEAFKKGAKICILERVIPNARPDKYPGKTLIFVDKMKDFLVSLAQPIAENIKIPIIAVTGSVGKTSTKNIIASVLSSKYKVLKTDGNLNTLMGMALTLLRLKNEEIIVLEMGMNHKGEISILSNFIKPDIGVITNIGTAHIGNLGSRENILEAKLEILEGLKGSLIINNDNDLLHTWHNKSQIPNEIITYGIENVSDYEASNISYDRFGSHFKINDEQIDINVIGRHFIYNALVAYTIGKLFNIETSKIIDKLKEIPLEHDRMELIVKDDITIINDTYNASYDSIYYALEVLKTFPGRKIAVLGDIGELGEFSSEIHTKIGDLIIENNIDALITLGEYSKKINERAIKLGFNPLNSYHFNTLEEIVNCIKSTKEKGNTYLIKASNSLKFNEIVLALK